MSYITLVNTLYISSPEEGSRSGMFMIGALDVAGVRHACDKSFICDSVHKNLYTVARSAYIHIQSLAPPLTLTYNSYRGHVITGSSLFPTSGPRDFPFCRRELACETTCRHGFNTCLHLIIPSSRINFI